MTCCLLVDKWIYTEVSTILFLPEKLLLMVLNGLVASHLHSVTFGRCFCIAGGVPLKLRCSEFGWDVDGGPKASDTAMYHHPPRWYLKNPTTALKHALIFTHTFVLTSLAVTRFFTFAVARSHTHKHINRRFKLLSLPRPFFFPTAASSNVFTPPPPHTHKTRGKEKKNHSLFLLYLLLKAHFSQQLPSVRY